MKILYARFKKRKYYSEVIVSFTGNYCIFPTKAKTKKEAMLDIKKQLHELVDRL